MPLWRPETPASFGSADEPDPLNDGRVDASLPTAHLSPARAALVRSMPKRRRDWERAKKSPRSVQSRKGFIAPHDTAPPRCEQVHRLLRLHQPLYAAR